MNASSPSRPPFSGMDSSGSSKPRKGLRKLMDKLSVSRSRSRSRSPSQSSQAGPGTLSQPIERTEGNESSPHVSNLPTGAIGTTGARLNIPIVVEPGAEGTASSKETLGNEKTLPQTNETENTAKSRVLSGTDKPANRSAWKTLRTSLHFLHETSDIFPPLSSAVGILLLCIDGLESVAKRRDDYAELATTLSAIIDSLKQHAGSMPTSDSGSLSNLALSLEQCAMEIRTTLDRMTTGRFQNASTDEEELLRHYQRVQSLFQQLQNTRLEGLRPVKQATYDSSLSTEVSRRGCTEGTRTAVLAELNTWLHDPNSPSIYWMNGMAGTGKTTIAYTFCEQVDNRKQLAASFFCTRNSTDCRDTSRIIPTISYQLARYSIPYRSALCDMLGHNPDAGSKYVMKQFEQLLKEPLQQVTTAMPDNLLVVIDALDECDSRNGIERVLDMLLRYAKQVPLKFLITSRPEYEIYNRMRLHQQSRVVIHLHDLESSLVQADIELYLTEELEFMSPTRIEIEQLAYRSGCLFIYAATLVRYILYGMRVANPRQRLQSVLSSTPQSGRNHAEIDALYKAILESALQEADMEEHEADDVKTVLQTVLFAQEPIGVETISVLGGLDDPERVLYALQPLRSVIHQSEETGLVSTLHASFPDFLLSSKRSGAFFCDVVQYSQPLAQRCFGVMKSQLRFNICALDSSFVSDDEVEDLESRIKLRITPTLAYACQYWANHLGMATRSGALSKMLNEFLSQRLLFWMEVLNLLKMINAGVDMLHKTNTWIKQIGSPLAEKELIELIEDSYIFVTSFAGSVASRSTPHIYISCLPFCSRSSQVYKHYWKRTQGLLQLTGSLIDCRSSAAMSYWKDDIFRAGTFSSDGSRYLGGLDDAVVIRDVYNGAILVGPMLGHTSDVCACCFSSDGAQAISASKDGAIRVWDAYNGRLISGPFHYDTSHIIALDYRVNTDDLGPVVFEQDTNFIRTIAWSPDGTRIAACFHAASTVCLWNAQTGMLIDALNLHTRLVTVVVMSPDGALFASAADDIRLWNVHDGTPAARPYQGHTPSIVCSVTFSPDSSHVISASDDIQVWRISDGAIISKFGFKPNIRTVAITPDGTQVASGSDHGMICIWKAEDGALLAGPFYASNGGNLIDASISHLMYTLEGSRLLARDVDGIITTRLVSHILSSSHMPVLQFSAGEIRSASFSSDGKAIFTLDKTSTIKGWDIRDGSSTEVLDEGHHFPSFDTPSISSPDGQYTSVRIGDGLQVINTWDGSIVLGPWRNTAGQFSQDSTIIATYTGSPDFSIKLWDLKTRQLIASPFAGDTSHPRYIAPSPDNSSIATLSWDSRVLRIFNTFTRVLDITTTSDPQLDSASNSTPAQVYEGWSIRKDGWVTNSSSHLLFCTPFEFNAGWPSPHTSLVIMSHGTVQVPKQTLFLGESWNRCYSSDIE
ncbi:Cell wall alpha-1,3-glucan synthase mok12 [Schizosaccharomyces pombe 972h-] [Rhizoctonia solani]|uniref:Cell wall alpha-1,3-glucan synthase mok12 [Schizosaccharomyces pombe 972h-] n=1 Tax=Rhizoctonia solani TaxID=456999 RepID=A0A0K6FXX2_9AGAM|nr:Cell wall alpha-1,3-glucan synthase mok12 [Schizosaccharomyces pombe 972h-] [Rhizoctonia solani]